MIRGIITSCMLALSVASAAAPATQPSRNAEGRSVLDQRIDLEALGVPLDKVLTTIGQKVGKRVVADAKALDAAGIDLAESVACDLKRVRADKAIRIVLNEARDNKTDFPLVVLDEGDSISVTAETVEKTVTFNVRDLLSKVPGATSQPGRPAYDSPGAKAKAQEIVVFLKETVDPPSWKGTRGIEVKEGKLIVRQWPSNQRAVGDLLDQLRITYASRR